MYCLFGKSFTWEISFNLQSESVRSMLFFVSPNFANKETDPERGIDLPKVVV